MKSAMTFSQSLQSLLTPPAKWLERDSFIIPSKDFLVALVKLRAHEAISNILCAISLEHPLSLEASNMLIVPLEMLMRKNVGGAADESRSSRHERARRAAASTARPLPRGIGSGWADGSASLARSSADRQPPAGSQEPTQPQSNHEAVPVANSENMDRLGGPELREHSTPAEIQNHPDATSTGKHDLFIPIALPNDEGSQAIRRCNPRRRIGARQTPWRRPCSVSRYVVLFHSATSFLPSFLRCV